MRRTHSFEGLLLGILYGFLGILLIGSFLSGYSQKRQFLEGHLTLTAQDTATSLALALSTAAAAEDWILASSMMDAIFDSGAYNRIELTDLQGQVIFSRKTPPGLEGVPAWFTRWVDLQPSAGDAMVVSGWRKTGQLSVTSSAGLAYRELWVYLRDQLIWFLIVGGLLGAGMHIILRLALVPLKRLTEAAGRVANQDFSTKLPPVSLRELSVVSEAFNSMSAHIRVILEGQWKEIERLRETEWLDPLTGLDNRASFDRRFAALLKGEESRGEAAGSEGVLLFLALEGLSGVNARAGRETGDRLLRQFGELLVDEVSGLVLPALIGRRDGAEFAIFLPGLEVDQAITWLQGFKRRWAGGALPEENASLRLVCGGIELRRGEALVSVLSRADQALTEIKAGASQDTNLVSLDQSDDLVLSGTQWRNLLQEALASQRFRLALQPVLPPEGDEPFYWQVRVRLPYQGEWLLAQQFLPRITLCGLASELDFWVLERALSRLEEEPQHAPVCVAFSQATLEDPALRSRLAALLSRFDAAAGRLYLEVPDYALMHAWPGVDALVELRRESGFRIVIGHFGVSAMPFGSLEGWSLDLVKLDHSLLDGLLEKETQARYVRGLIDVLHARGLKVIATGVEDDATKEALLQAGIDGMMGYWFQASDDAPIW